MPQSKRTVLITGCTDGSIGAALAKEYHSRGLLVFASSRRVDTMKELASLGIATLALDVTNTNSIRSVRDIISTETGGRLDILVNNAGQFWESPAIDASIPATRALFELNVFAPMQMVQELFSLLQAGMNPCIVNIGSGSGLLPIPLQSGYNASKAALHSFSDTLRVEVEPFGIKVVTVITNSVKSNIRGSPTHFLDDSLYKSLENAFSAQHIETEKAAEPTDKYARMVVSETIKSNPRNWIWGGTMSGMTWFLLAFFPRWVPEKVVVNMYGFDKFSAKVKRERAGKERK
ncbi:short chain dehydrogenase reductase [Favolaschia claudopus]|uniref:Short chain dehydrogenase reductase n=1 Tax=Favolaschia claudopus TaxID=2862362 RepID=A0AAW0E823_9AGAR